MSDAAPAAELVADGAQLVESGVSCKQATDSHSTMVTDFRPENFYTVALEEIALMGGSRGLSLDCLWRRLARRILPPTGDSRSALDANYRAFVLAALARAPSSDLEAFEVTEGTGKEVSRPISLANLANCLPAEVLLVASKSIRRRQLGVVVDADKLSHDCWSVLELAGTAGSAGLPLPGDDIAENATTGSTRQKSIIRRLVRLGLLHVGRINEQPSHEANSVDGNVCDKRRFYWLTRFAPSTNRAPKRTSQESGTDTVDRLGGCSRKRLKLFDESIPLRTQLLKCLSDDTPSSPDDLANSLAFGCRSLAEARSSLAWLTNRRLCFKESDISYRAISLKSAFLTASGPAYSTDSAVNDDSEILEVDKATVKRHRASARSSLDAGSNSGEFKRPLAPPLSSRLRHSHLNSLLFSRSRVLQYFAQHKICLLAELSELTSCILADSKLQQQQALGPDTTAHKSLIKTLDLLTSSGCLRLVSIRIPSNKTSTNEEQEPATKLVQLYALADIANEPETLQQLLGERLARQQQRDDASAEAAKPEALSEADNAASEQGSADDKIKDNQAGADCLPHNMTRPPNISPFSRAQLVYEFLWYLVYKLPVDQGPVFPRNTIELDGQPVTLPPVYSDTEDWRRYVFPLYSSSVTGHYPKTVPSAGWIHKFDVLMRMPLALYDIAIQSVGNCSSPLLVRYMRHPQLRWLPLATLPDNNVRALMLVRSRSVVLTRTQPFRILSGMGLLYWLKKAASPADNSMMYLTNRLSLLDTRLSKPVIDYLETKSYPPLCFEMQREDDVLGAWRQSARILVHTPIEYTESDARSRAHYKVRFIDCEDGDTIDGLLAEPFGDHLGACGFSSKLSRALILTDPRDQKQEEASSQTATNGVSEASSSSSGKRSADNFYTNLSLFGDMRSHIINMFDTKPIVEHAPSPTLSSATSATASSRRRPRRSSTRALPSAESDSEAEQRVDKRRGCANVSWRPRQTALNPKALAARTREARKLVRKSNENVQQQQQQLFSSTLPNFSVESTRRRIRQLSMALSGAAPVTSRIWSPEEDTVLLFCHLAYLLVFNDRECKFSDTAANLIAEFVPSSTAVLANQSKDRHVCQRRFNFLFKRKRRNLDAAIQRVRDALYLRLRKSETVRAWLVRPRAAWSKNCGNQPLAGDRAWREPHFRRIVIGLMHQDEAAELLALTPPAAAAAAAEAGDVFSGENPLAEDDEVINSHQLYRPVIMEDDSDVEEDQNGPCENDGLDQIARVASHADCMIDALAWYILICVQSFAECQSSDIDARLTAVINAYPIEIAESALRRLTSHSDLLGESPLVRAKHGDSMSLTSRRLKLRQGAVAICPPAVDAYFASCAELNNVGCWRSILDDFGEGAGCVEAKDVNGPVAALCAAAALDANLVQYKWDWSLERLHFLNTGAGSDIFNEAVDFSAAAATSADGGTIVAEADNNDDEATMSSIPSLTQMLPPPLPSPQQQQQQQLLPLFRFANNNWLKSLNSSADGCAKSTPPLCFWPPEFHCAVADADISTSTPAASSNSRILRALAEIVGDGGGVSTDSACGVTPLELCRRLGVSPNTTASSNSSSSVSERQLADLDAELMRLIQANAVFLVGHNVPYLVHRKLMRACLVNLNPRGLKHQLLAPSDRRYILPAHWSDHLGRYRPRRHAAQLRRILSACAERSGCCLTALCRSAGPTLGLVGLYKLLHQLSQFGCLTLTAAVPISEHQSAAAASVGLFSPRTDYRLRPATLFDDWRRVTVRVQPAAELSLAAALQNLVDADS